MQVQWCPGMRLKMASETEDSSRISWFMGTVAGVHVADPIRWPQSPWRLLQVSWDEPELLQNVKRVCPWLVELVSSMPNLHLPSFSPPRKKPRIPSYAELPFEGQLFNPAAPFPPSSLAPHGHHHGYPFYPFPDSSAPLAGVQGARHAQLGPSFSDLNFNDLQASLLHSGIRRPVPERVSTPRAPRISTELTIGSPPGREDEAAKKPKPPVLLLFGQAILTEEQMKASSKENLPQKKASSKPGGVTTPRATGCGSPNWEPEKLGNVSEGSSSGLTIQDSPTNNNSPSWKLQWFGDNSNQTSEFGLEPGQCKVFMESDAVGRNLDLAAVSSFEELYTRLSNMFGIDGAEVKSHVLYRSAGGEVKHIGDEPFRAFVKSARRLTILTDAGSDNIGA